MSEYIIDFYKNPRSNRKPEPPVQRPQDWMQKKELWKQIVDRYHRGTRRIPSPQ